MTPHPIPSTCPYHAPFTHNPQPQGISEEQVLQWAASILEARFRPSNYLTNPAHTREYLKIVFAGETREQFGVIYMDNQHGIMGFEILFQGTIDSAAVYPREVVKAALKHNASAVILAHNHPSGSITPSSADQGITARISQALMTVDIRVLDHLVIGDQQMCSFAEQGLLPN